MTLQIRLFAAARDLAGTEVTEIELTDAATVRNLREALIEKHSQLAAMAKHLLIAIDNTYATDETQIQPDNTIACFPPVSGG